MSIEWVAFRLARFHSKGLVVRGTFAEFAHRQALEEYSNAFSLLTVPRALTVAMWHHPLIAPFPDIDDRWLVVLKSALESARDAIVETPHLGDAYMYIPPELGAVMSWDRVAMGQRLNNWHLST